MAGSGEVLASQVALTEGDDVFSDDPRGDGKKKKFKPFQKMRNFFRGGSSKKRFKVGEGGGDSVKSQSTGALHSPGNNMEDEEDDGGFNRSRKTSGLAGSRSISEDSIFKPDAQKDAPAPVGVLAGQTVSMERINSDFQSELFSKLKGRQSDSDIDEGLPYSPNPNSNIFDAAMKETTSSSIGGKPMSQDSEQSLISVDGSEEDLFESDWTSGVASVKRSKTASTGSTESLDNMEVSDFEGVQMRTGHALSNEAAKHRISVKPKTRRISSKKSFKTKEKPSVQTSLPDVKEEPVPKSPVKDIKQDEQMKPTVKQHKTIISTTIPIGNPPDSNVTPVPRSDPKDIPQPRRNYDESGRMSRSLSPLSTSPVSQSMLQDVKLRSRPLSGKFDHIETKKEENESELSQIFNKAKRFSRKYDAEGKIIDGNSDNVKPVVKSDSKTVTGPKLEAVVNKDIAQKDGSKKDLTVPVLSSSNKETTAASSSPTSPPAVSYVLKKEPLRPGNKGTETSNPTVVQSGTEKQEAESTAKSSMGTKVVETGTADKPVADDKQGTNSMVAPATVSASKTVTQTTKQTVTQAAPQNVTQTGTPAVSQNVTQTVSQSSTQAVPQNVSQAKPQTGSQSMLGTKTASPEKLPSPREEYRLKRQNRSKTLPVSKELIDKAEELEKSNIKPLRGKSPPAVNTIRTAQYDNVVLDQKPIQSKRMSWASSTGTTANSEPSWVIKAKQKEVEKKAEADKKDVLKEIKVEVKGNTENKPATDTKVTKTDVSETKPASSAVEKTVNQPVKSWARTVTTKPLEKPAVESSSKPLTQSSTVKPLSQSMRGSLSTQTSGQKPPIPSSAKPLSQSLKAAFDSKVSHLGNTNKTASVTQKPGVNKPVVETVKPVTQSAVKPLGSVNTNTTKLDNRETTKPSVSDSRKMFLNQENKKIESETKKDSITPSTGRSVFERPKVTGTTATTRSDTTANIPEWKKALKKSTMTQQVNIEIIDKEPEKKKPEVKKQENKVEEKPVTFKDKAKTTPEKCSDNRSSKVLDMVKSFQKLQVT